MKNLEKSKETKFKKQKVGETESKKSPVRGQREVAGYKLGHTPSQRKALIRTSASFQWLDNAKQQEEKLLR